MTRFPTCHNCGWTGVPRDFTLNWCDECATAFIKGFISAVAGAAGLGLVGLVVRYAGWLASL